MSSTPLPATPSTEGDWLRPDRRIHKLLISTPSHFVGEYTSADLLITHAWPSFAHGSTYSMLHSGAPTERTFLMVAFPGPSDDERAGARRRPLTDFSYVGDIVCAFLALLFGKRFDNHGLVETHGFFQIPFLESLTPVSLRFCPPFDNTPRREAPVELHLARVVLLQPILRPYFDESVESKELDILFAAARFYLEALQRVEHEPDLAFIALVSAGEVFASLLEFSEAELFDDRMLALLNDVESKLGSDTRKKISNRLFQVRRKFATGLARFTSPPLFAGSASNHPLAILPTDELPQRLRAAYDLRSRYMHTGQRFGGWISPQRGLEDITMGRPVVDDREFETILMRTPTFVGLERLVRFVLLRYIHQKVTPISEDLI